MVVRYELTDPELFFAPKINPRNKTIASSIKDVVGVGSLEEVEEGNSPKTVDRLNTLISNPHMVALNVGQQGKVISAALNANCFELSIEDIQLILAEGAVAYRDSLWKDPVLDSNTDVAFGAGKITLYSKKEIQYFKTIFATYFREALQNPGRKTASTKQKRFISKLGAGLSVPPTKVLKHLAESGSDLLIYAYLSIVSQSMSHVDYKELCQVLGVNNYGEKFFERALELAQEYVIDCGGKADPKQEIANRVKYVYFDKARHDLLGEAGFTSQIFHGYIKLVLLGDFWGEGHRLQPFLETPQQVLSTQGKLGQGIYLLFVAKALQEENVSAPIISCFVRRWESFFAHFGGSAWKTKVFLEKLEKTYPEVYLGWVIELELGIDIECESRVVDVW